MDIDFPEPYDLEVPRRISEAREGLSLEGVAVLDRLVEASGNPEDAIAAMEQLPDSERRELFNISALLAEAYEASARENQGWADLHRQLLSLIRRAQGLDPSLGESPTLGEAVAVLRRHGEPLGISDEVLEMAVEPDK